MSLADLPLPRSVQRVLKVLGVLAAAAAAVVTCYMGGEAWVVRKAHAEAVVVAREVVAAEVAPVKADTAKLKGWARGTRQDVAFLRCAMVAHVNEKPNDMLKCDAPAPEPGAEPPPPGK